MPGKRGACGRALHGKASPDGGPSLCFGCGRPGSRDGISTGWQHVGASTYWVHLKEWSRTVGEGWVHRRDFLKDPLKVGECICGRPDCVSGMYRLYQLRVLKEEKGSLDTMVVGQSSPMGRYPSTSFQVRALLEHVEVAGGVLDGCGATQDAVSTVLTAHGLRVATNDFDPMLVADSHMDAATDAFREHFSNETLRPDWIVTSPPYRTAFAILKQALPIARIGVAFKLRLRFLEPTKTRVGWFQKNPPDTVVVLPRATYRGRKCCSTEAWFVWHHVKGENAQGRPAFRFATQ